MKQTTTYIVAALVFGLFSCKKEMININTNPTIVNSAPPEFQFTSATTDLDLSTGGQLLNRYGFMVLMQYIVPDGVSADLTTSYWSPGATTGPAPSVSYYDDYYSGPSGGSGIGTHLHEIISQIDLMPQEQAQTYAYLKAICQVLDVYHAWRVVDIYGAMPYFQAFNGTIYPQPAYDFDWTLYKNFDSTLKVAATVLSTASIPAAFQSQDLFYSGDAPSWEAFANTLRIRIALRFAKRDPADLSSVLTDLSANFGSKIISSNAQSFGYTHTQTWNNDVDNINAILLSYNASFAFVSYLKSTQDPRLPLMIRQNDMGTNSAQYIAVIDSGNAASKQLLADSSAFVNSRYWGRHAFPTSTGAQYGWTGSGRYQTFGLTNGSSVSLGVLSAIQSRYFVKNGGFGNLNQTQTFLHTDETQVDGSTIRNRTVYLSYAETCFMMAEIAQQGGNGLGQSAAQWYNAGVQASFSQYVSDAEAGNVPGADTVTIGNFLNRYAYDGTLARIYSQEWVHLMTNPEEAYALWKRTGYPQFASDLYGQPTTIGDGKGTAYLEALDNNGTDMIIPRRAPFTLENAASTLNQNSFNTALSTMQSFNPAFGPNGSYAIGRIWWDE